MYSSNTKIAAGLRPQRTNPEHGEFSAQSTERGDHAAWPVELLLESNVLCSVPRIGNRAIGRIWVVIFRTQSPTIDSEAKGGSDHVNHRKSPSRKQATLGPSSWSGGHTWKTHRIFEWLGIFSAGVLLFAPNNFATIFLHGREYAAMEKSSDATVMSPVRFCR
jgi:hypothetical protein